MHRACSRLRQRNPDLFVVGSLFANNEQGAWYDPSDMNTLFQDSAGTVPVTASGDPVGLILDKSGRGNHAAQTTAGSRPTFRDVSGLRYLEFDGADDFLVTASINFSVTDKMSLYAGVRKLSDVATGIITELSANSGTNSGSFYLEGPGNNATANYGTVLNGSAVTIFSMTTYTSPITSVISVLYDIAQATRALEIVPRINGVTPTLTGSGAASAGTGSFGNHPLYIGRRGGATLPFNGHVYGLILRGSLSDSSTVAASERYLAAKTGVTLS